MPSSSRSFYLAYIPTGTWENNTQIWSIRAWRLLIISSLSSSSTHLIATMAESSHSHQVTKSCWKFHIGKFQTFQDLPLVFQNNSRTFSVLRNLRTFQGWPWIQSRRRNPVLKQLKNREKSHSHYNDWCLTSLENDSVSSAAWKRHRLTANKTKSNEQLR